MSKHADIETDVLVVGAGTAGIPAALGAARVGARVLLIEEDSVVGGVPVDCYVDCFCGGPLTGALQEAATILQAKCRLAREIKKGNCFFLPESFVRVFGQMLQAERKITVWTQARAVDVLRAGRGPRPQVSGVVVDRGFMGNLRIESKITIDATGSGWLALRAGCRSMYGREARSDFNEKHAPAKRDTRVQDCTWMYFSQQLGAGAPFDMMKLDHARHVLVNGWGYFCDNPEKAMRIKPRIYLHWGCAVNCKDTRDPVELGRTQAEALQAMERDHALLRAHGYAIYLAPRIGVRETSRILGEKVITENDLRSGVLSEDAIAVGNYGLDIWGEGIPPGETTVPGYGIPYGAIVPKDADGLLLAGKAISGTHVAMSAYRVMPIVGGIGQAAGVAAALCVRQGCQPRDLSCAEVRKVLRGKKQNVPLRF